MTKLSLSVAVGDYDRVRPLVDGAVGIDGVEPIFMALEPEEIFFRAFRHADFDICELSLSSFAVKTAKGDCPYVGVPVFPSRAFRHTSIYVRTGRGLVERHPFLPAAVAKAFAVAKTLALAKLTDTSATKVTLPFVEEQLRAARALLGEDFWSYGLAANRHVLAAFLDAHHAQGLSARRLQPEELFHPATHETHSI